MDEMETMSKLIRQNADFVENKTLERVNILYSEKRKARKKYQEDHNRIALELTHVSTHCMHLFNYYLF